MRVEELGQPPDTVARHPTAPSPARLSESDLEAFLEPWYPSLKATLDELGAEAVEDLKELEAEHIDALASKLKVLQAKKFRKKLVLLWKQLVYLVYHITLIKNTLENTIYLKI